MKKTELFSHTDNSRTANPRPTPTRTRSTPRSPLAPYVLDHLPADLDAVAHGRVTYEELAAKQRGVLHALDDGTPLATDAPSAALVQLDLLFMLNGYLPAGPEAFPRPLLDAIAAQCARFPALDPYLSYETLIDVNCAEWDRTGDIRVFSAGGLGLLERDFYLGHHLAEPPVRIAFELLRALVLEPAAVGTAALLEEALRCLDDFRSHMVQYGRLPTEAFHAFRRYHMSYPGGPRGASGAFMPSVQLLELVLLPPTPQYGVYLDQSLPYFPTWSRTLVTEWRALSRKGDNLVDAVLDGRLKLDDRAATALLRVIDTFTDFRMVHLGVTRKALPEAFASDAKPTRKAIAALGGERDILGEGDPGTSGFSVHNVLTNAVYRLLAARRSLTEFFD
ncbi:hypothetical protein [Streptomyces sp. ST1015]|uniref:hypothetical protein n=1 Tax=unclassified Streptomyces TaxID=2593676 RepID=UPI000DD846A1|nr:hypothetical protein [Streptomyces sp. ST1015]QZZ31636.1 hypothetical protein A7X85_40325 [Streptomyces sp. ST1015]